MSNLPSTRQDRFSRVPDADIQRSSFDRSHGLKTSFDAGLLVPIYVDEALPGDTFSLNMTAFARMSTPIYPVMDNLYLETFFFAIPLRLVWDNFQRFMGEQISPGASTDFVVPQTLINAPGFTENSIADYFGLPTKVGPLSVNALPFRAYHLVWNEWFRDQNLQGPATVPLTDGPDVAGTYLGPAIRGRRHDYFTSALPWPQKGDGVEIPLAGLAPIVGIGVTTTATGAAGGVNVRETGNLITSYGWERYSGSTPFVYEVDQAGVGASPMIYAELARTSNGGTINELRQAFQLQKMLERDARGGTRYTEIIRAHFGVTSPDARLQRPEYLGGGTTSINIQPIHQTSEDGATPLGQLGGIGTATAHRHGFSKSFTEHSIIIGLANVRADLTYQQGTDRMWSRSTKYDFFWPALANIGEQAILKKEIYTQGTATDDTVFGYQERYGEYRYKPSRVTGVMRSNATVSLDAWHLALEFTAEPALSAFFIEDRPPMDRVLAVPSEPDFIMDAFFSLRCARPMPMYGIPGMTDHF